MGRNIFAVLFVESVFDLIRFIFRFDLSRSFDILNLGGVLFYGVCVTRGISTQRCLTMKFINVPYKILYFLL